VCRGPAFELAHDRDSVFVGHLLGVGPHRGVDVTSGGHIVAGCCPARGIRRKGLGSGARDPFQVRLVRRITR
jgi:hypothetical protein